MTLFSQARGGEIQFYVDASQMIELSINGTVLLITTVANSNIVNDIMMSVSAGQCLTLTTLN